VGDLQQMGYRVAAGIQSAAEVGASHIRQRLFILAHANLQGERKPGVSARRARGVKVQERSESDREAGRHQERCLSMDAVLGHPNGVGVDAGTVPLFAPGPGQFRMWGETLDRWPSLKPSLYRPVDGLAFGLDRSAAAGNGVVAVAAARAWLDLRAALRA
jgi:DNA (cytosine-5)-methyltransferase 1